MPQGTVVDSQGNILYVQPLPPLYRAQTADGQVVGLFADLALAKAALAQSPGGTVSDPAGKVVYTQPQPNPNPSPGPSPSPQPATDFTNVDLRFPAPANITPQLIDQFLTAHNSPLAGLGQVFVWAQKMYGVNANYLVSHAILETGWGKSKICIQKNNLYGYGAFDSNPGVDAGVFPSQEYAVRFQAWVVRQSYLTPGASLYVAPTLKGMNVNYASDQQWANSIGSLMNQLAQAAGDSVKSYRAYVPGQSAPTPPSTQEPVFLMNGARAVVVANPWYKDLPYYPDMGTGMRQMFTRVLSYGDRGSDVATLQSALNQQLNAGLTVDGIFGPKTQAAVKQMQQKLGLRVTGQCDFTLWSKLVPAPKTTIPANTQVTVDKMQQGMAAGLVTEWYHIPQYGWVDSQFVHFSNVYRLTVPDPLSPADVNVPIYDPAHPSVVMATLRSGDYVVSKQSQPANGVYTILFADQQSGKMLTGILHASDATLTQVQ